MTRYRWALACLAAAAAISIARPAAEPAPVHLTDVSSAAGLDFVYQHSPTPENSFVESVPAGLAVFDYNGDGRPDIFFANGAKTPALEKAGAMYANRLYRNDGG